VYLILGDQSAPIEPRRNPGVARRFDNRAVDGGGSALGVLLARGGAGKTGCVGTDVDVKFARENLGAGRRIPR
jgi:hypothetical protein